MMGTMYFLWARCAQHGGSASGGGLVCVSLLSYRALVIRSLASRWPIADPFALSISGVFRTFQFPNEGQHGTAFKVVTQRSFVFKSKYTCEKLSGTQASPIQLQNLLPDLEGFQVTISLFPLCGFLSPKCEYFE